MICTNTVKQQGLNVVNRGRCRWLQETPAKDRPSSNLAAGSQRDLRSTVKQGSQHGQPGRCRWLQRRQPKNGRTLQGPGSWFTACSAQRTVKQRGFSVVSRVAAGDRDASTAGKQTELGGNTGTLNPEEQGYPDWSDWRLVLAPCQPGADLTVL
jgi:hypothetical protein